MLKYVESLKPSVVIAVLCIYALANGPTVSADAHTGSCHALRRPEWSPVEQWVWETICDGQVANLTDRDLLNRSVSSSFLEMILLDREFQKAIPPSGVAIRGAHFSSEINLSHGTILRPLYVNHSVFMDKVIMNRVQTDQLVSFNNSTFDDELRIESADFGNDLYLEGITGTNLILPDASITGNLSLGPRAEFGWVNMMGTRIGKRLDIGGQFEILHMKSASIVGPLSISELEVELVDLNGLSYSTLAPSKTGVYTNVSDLANAVLDVLDHSWEFTDEPYYQLVSVLRASGASLKASQVMLVANDRRLSWSRGWTKIWLIVLRWSVGYSLWPYILLFPLIWIGVFTVIGSRVLWLFGELQFATKQHILGRHGLWFSLDYVLPFLRLNNGHHERVNLSLLLTSGTARGYFYFHQLIGYFLSVFVLGGLAKLAN